MTINNGYCTLAEFKAYEKITTTDATDDAVIEDIIEGASRLIDGYCGRFFYQISDTRYYNTCETDGVDTDDIYTTSGLTIMVDSDGDGTHENTMSSTDYNAIPYNPEPGFPYIGFELSPAPTIGFSKVRRGVKITASFGWAAIPDSVKQACLIISSAEYHRRFGENTSAAATITGAGVVITPQGIPLSAVQLLNRFRKHV